MLERLLKKNERGFTLAELLVVVAIIAILVAVSIPIFTSKLEASREATDKANERAAKAAATVAILDEDMSGFTDKVGFYDAENGKIIKTNTITKGYGKGTSAGTVNADNAGKVIQVTVAGENATDTEKTVGLLWVNAATE